MTWAVMDIRDMSALEPHTFDVILEKGTFDAMLAEEKDPWNVSEAGEQMIHDILSEVGLLFTKISYF